jgi:hypothetical protein
MQHTIPLPDASVSTLREMMRDDGHSCESSCLPGLIENGNRKRSSRRQVLLARRLQIAREALVPLRVDSEDLPGTEDELYDHLGGTDRPVLVTIQGRLFAVLLGSAASGRSNRSWTSPLTTLSTSWALSIGLVDVRVPLRAAGAGHSRLPCML